MKKGTVIHCHGFASSGKGPKSDALVAEFGADRVVSPNIPVDPVAAEALLDTLIVAALREGDGNVVIVGTSLGGFWANYMAHKWLLPCVMVNPSTDPDTTMAERVGVQMNNYATGEPILITDADVAGYAARKNSKCMTVPLDESHLFLAKDDDVLDYRIAEATIDATSTTIMTDGGHRFEKYWPDVVLAVKKLLS